MKNYTLLPVLLSALGLSLAAGCRPRADASTKIQHPALAGNVEANEVEWNDGTEFGLTKNVYRNVASLTEMTPDQVCFEVILSGFDDEATAQLARAGFVLYVDGQRFTPRVEQLVEPHASEHKGKKTEFETVDTGLREDVCVDGVKNDRGEIVSCTRWQQNKITETHAYDVPMMYNVVQGAGQACFDTKGKIKPAEVENLLLEITNAKSERTSAFWGVRYKATTRLRWDLLGDVPETVGDKWGGFGGTKLAEAAQGDAPKKKQAEPEPEPEPEELALEKIGVPACDEYIEKMLACAEKQPAAAKKPMQDSAKTSAETFKKSAATKTGKATLAKSCSASIQALKQNPTCK